MGSTDARLGEWLDDAGGAVQYALVFVLAAIPWIELLVVVPIAIAVGLDPVFVAVFAFSGNVLPIYGIVVGYERLTNWLDREPSEPSGRKKRAKRLWNRYGLPGLALCAPILTGVHLAALAALGLGATGRRTMLWMTASIGLWTVVVTAASVLGIAYLFG